MEGHKQKDELLLRCSSRLSASKRGDLEEDLFSRAYVAKIRALYLVSDRTTIITVRRTTIYKTDMSKMTMNGNRFVIKYTLVQSVKLNLENFEMVYK